MTDILPTYESAEQLFFELPLYEVVSITSNQLFTLHGNALRIDGYCPYCRVRRVFVSEKPDWHYEQINTMTTADLPFYDLTTLYCSYIPAHQLKFVLRIRKGTISKVGQYPSFADIALDESKEYRDILDGEETSEFHKAIGLAAHGVGIGSFVYLRRIFERLIWNRFDEFKEAENWKDEDFQKIA